MHFCTSAPVFDLLQAYFLIMQLVFISGRSNLRGSLPNVSRLIPHTQHHASDSSLADHQYEDYPPDPRYNR